MARWAVIRNGVVENVIEWDGGDGWEPPEGAKLVEDAMGVAGPGDLHDGKDFTRVKAELPAVDAEVKAILEKDDKDVTVDELKTVTLALARKAF